jgi:hypothetical protein
VCVSARGATNPDYSFCVKDLPPENSLRNGKTSWTPLFIVFAYASGSYMMTLFLLYLPVV